MRESALSLNSAFDGAYNCLLRMENGMGSKFLRKIVRDKSDLYVEVQVLRKNLNEATQRNSALEDEIK